MAAARQIRRCIASRGEASAQKFAKDAGMKLRTMRSSRSAFMISRDDPLGKSSRPTAYQLHLSACCAGCGCAWPEVELGRKDGARAHRCTVS